MATLISCSKKSDGDNPFIPPSSPEKLNLGSVSNQGIFDPGLTYDTANGVLWMSYSAVDTSSQLETTQRVVSTRVASSNDGGVSWVDQGIVLAGVNNVSISFSGLPSLGSWHNEVSRILFDPGSASGSDRWKLLTHHYLQVKTTDSSAERRFEHGWISYKKASSPQLLASATETKLFGAAGYNAANDTPGGATGSPVGGAPVINLQNLHPDLNGCLIFTEPGVLSTSTHLYLSLICVEATNFRVALFSCLQPCAVTSGWSYTKTVLQNAEAVGLGYLNFSASELFTYQDEHYLMVSPEGVTGAPGIYHGCYIYKFSNITTGALVSSSPIKSVSGSAESFNGSCSFNENATNGFYYSEIDLSESDFFRVFKSNLKF